MKKVVLFLMTFMVSFIFLYPAKALENASEMLKNRVVNSGDGLYEDFTEEGRYIYRGDNPDNYIDFNNEVWRIISVEKDGTLKIVRENNIARLPWDESGARNNSENPYCKSVFGCNAWAANDHLVGSPSEIILAIPNGNIATDTEKASGVVTKDASLNTYLNEEYYNSLDAATKKYIVSHDFNVGTPGGAEDVEDLETNVRQEALYKWNGNIGLMSMLDVLKTATNLGCNTLKDAATNNEHVCSYNNWLWTEGWTITPGADSNRTDVWYIHPGNAHSWSPNGTSGVQPVLYLRGDISLTGSGTKQDLYKIVTEEENAEVVVVPNTAAQMSIIIASIGIIFVSLAVIITKKITKKKEN